MLPKIAPLRMAVSALCLCAVLSAKSAPRVEKPDDHKELRKIIRTRNNVLVLYHQGESGLDKKLKLLSDVGQAVRGSGTVAWVDCGNSEGRKLCKKMKVESGGTSKLMHYKDGEFHVEYDRAETFKSLVAFMFDPTGDPLWEEEPDAKDVVHVHSDKEFRLLLKKEERPILMMFYAPWCGVCKRMKPVFQEAATMAKKTYVLAGMNVHPAEFDGIKSDFNVTGYPTFCYFEKGKFRFNYQSYGAQAKDIIEWLKNPESPKPTVPEVAWSETDSAVFHLTDEDFQDFVDKHPNVLVMFYAPWCGHCKKLKPDYDEAAKILNEEENSPGVLAAVDATIHRALAERFSIKGFPTTKFFQDGEEKYTVSDLRSKDKILSWIRDPQPPPPPEVPWDEQENDVAHLSVATFRDFLKKKRHALLMFYAPWCFHCKQAKPHFTAAAAQLKDDHKVALAAVDCTKQDNNELCSQEGVRGYPTMNHYTYGKFVGPYTGGRQEADFINFLLSLRGKSHSEL
ncbi:unnamed protein product [Lampetra planeri]